MPFQKYLRFYDHPPCFSDASIMYGFLWWSPRLLNVCNEATPRILECCANSILLLTSWTVLLGSETELEVLSNSPIFPWKHLKKSCWIGIYTQFQKTDGLANCQNSTAVSERGCLDSHPWETSTNLLSRWNKLIPRDGIGLYLEDRVKFSRSRGLQFQSLIFNSKEKLLESKLS